MGVKITQEWLKDQLACKAGLEWFVSQKETEGLNIARKLIEENPGWANWLIIKMMNKPQKVRYAIFADNIAKKWAKKPSEISTNTDYTFAFIAHAVATAANAAHGAYITADAAYLSVNRATYDATKKEILKEIIQYGISLVLEEK